MARYILDTHSFLWAHLEPHKLSKKATNLLESQSAELIFSVASSWEICTKYNLGKLALPVAPDIFMRRILAQTGYEVLPLTLVHTFALPKLELHHNDPFDRMIICQAMLEKIPIIISDPLMEKYDVTCIW